MEHRLLKKYDQFKIKNKKEKTEMLFEYLKEFEKYDHGFTKIREKISSNFDKLSEGQIENVFYTILEAINYQNHLDRKKYEQNYANRKQSIETEETEPSLQEIEAELFDKIELCE